MNGEGTASDDTARPLSLKPETQRPAVGVGVFVYKDGQFLMIQRAGHHGPGTWSVPGGYIEFGESWEEAAAREILEETNVKIKNPRFMTITNNIFKSENKHTITIWIESEYASGTPKIMEPEKCTALEWRTFTNLPSPLFIPFELLKKTRSELFAKPS